MINKLMIGRMGNQMFQYATMRAIQLKYYPDEDINLNFTLVYKEGEMAKGFKNQLECFNLAPHFVDKKINISFSQKIWFLRYYLGYKILKIFARGDYEVAKRKYEIRLQPKLQKRGLFLFSFGYFRFEKSDKKNKLFVGFYESDKYFDGIRDVLRTEFEPKYPERIENAELYKIIRDKESICISIRRGDFLAPDQIEKNYVCTVEYFQKGIELMKEKISDPKFVVFSDDIKWVRENMKFPDGTIFENGDDPVWEKLRLMYNCKHFIISNSTFSWWAQYLSKNDKNKIVIAPKIWKNSGFNDDIYQDGWIRI